MTPRLAAYGLITAVLLVALISAGVVVNGWRRDSLALPAVQMRLAATIAAEGTARRIRADVTKGYADEIATLRAAAARPGRVIRVCDNPVPSTAGGATGRADDPGATSGQLPPDAGRDIGPALYAEADRADQVAAQLRALQDWARKVTAVPP